VDTVRDNFKVTQLIVRTIVQRLKLGLISLSGVTTTTTVTPGDGRTDSNAHVAVEWDPG
jgi:hypothetical protein